MSHKLYVPVCKVKDGECKGLRELDKLVFKHVVPLLELGPGDKEKTRALRIAETEGLADDDPKRLARPKVTLEEQYRNIGMRTLKMLPDDITVYLDGSMLDHSIRIDNKTPLEYFLDVLRGKNINAIIVAAADSREEVLVGGHEIAIRVTPSDVNSSVGTLSQRLNIPISDIHLIVDNRRYDGDHQVFGQGAVSVLNSINHINDFSRVVWIMTSFPVMSALPTDHQMKSFNRNEWQIWKTMINGGYGHLIRLPAFGDYNVDNPGWSYLESARAGDNFRYTRGNNYLILKSGLFSKTKGSGTRIAYSLIQADATFDPMFCWADGEISTIVANGGSTGGATKFRQVGINRHVTVVANDIAAI